MVVWSWISVIWKAPANVSCVDSSFLAFRILIVSGPTVVAPLLEMARPGRRVTLILGWEKVRPSIPRRHHRSVGGAEAVLAFLRSIGVGGLRGVIGTATLWLLLDKARRLGPRH
jgi:hypothetical protein